MAFILAKERDAGAVDAFDRYRQYLKAERQRFPPGAFALATSLWYFDSQDHRCPHDAWLQHVVLQETGTGAREEHRALGLSIQLLGAYHDLVLRFEYRGLSRYSLQGESVRTGHSDWRYDEFRVSEAGSLLHEIEWSGGTETARWLIEAEDVALEWSALAGDA